MSEGRQKSSGDKGTSLNGLLSTDFGDLIERIMAGVKLALDVRLEGLKPPIQNFRD